MSDLVLASDAQKRARDLLAWRAWGERLTPEQFVRREDRLRATAWAREGMRTWLLVDRGEVLASCETFRMESSASGEPGTTQGVASVFTEERLRGRGHASRMMALLGERLRSEGAQASVLFSDVGPDLYARQGWAAVPAVDRVLDPAPGDPASVAELLREEELPGALASLPPATGGFSIRPTAAQIEWHLERERSYSELLDLARPERYGARAGDALLVWCGNLKADELVGLVYRASSPESARAVLEAAARTAAAADMRRMVLWERGEVQPWPTSARREPRKGSLPMIRCFAAGLQPRDWVDTERALWI